MQSIFRHRIPLLGILALAFALNSGPAMAGIVWCKSDPTVKIGGNVVHIDVYSTEGILTAVSGPTKVRIAIPQGVKAELLAQDDGFGLGWTVEFERQEDLRVSDRGVQTRVFVEVPASGVFPVKVEIVDRGDDVLDRAFGETNATVGARAWL